MMTQNENNPNQKWIFSDYGKQIINVGTNLPMKAGKGRNWIWDKEGMVMIDARRTNEVMDRGWQEKDGKSVGTWGRHGGANQLFINTNDVFSEIGLTGKTGHVLRKGAVYSKSPGL